MPTVVRKVDKADDSYHELSRFISRVTYPASGTVDSFALFVKVIHDANGHLLRLKRRTMPVLKPGGGTIQPVCVGHQACSLADPTSEASYVCRGDGCTASSEEPS